MDNNEIQLRSGREWDSNPGDLRFDSYWVAVLAAYIEIRIT